MTVTPTHANRFVDSHTPDAFDANLHIQRETSTPTHAPTVQVPGHTPEIPPVKPRSRYTIVWLITEYPLAVVLTVFTGIGLLVLALVALSDFVGWWGGNSAKLTLLGVLDDPELPDKLGKLAASVIGRKKLQENLVKALTTLIKGAGDPLRDELAKTLTDDKLSVNIETALGKALTSEQNREALANFIASDKNEAAISSLLDSQKDKLIEKLSELLTSETTKEGLSEALSQVLSETVVGASYSMPIKAVTIPLRAVANYWRGGSSTGADGEGSGKTNKT